MISVRLLVFQNLSSILQPVAALAIITWYIFQLGYLNVSLFLLNGIKYIIFQWKNAEYNSITEWWV